MPASRPPYSSALLNDQPYESVDSAAARAVLEAHYDVGANLYKFWGSPVSVLRAILLGWPRSNHPAHLHYAWDLESAPSLDAGILETTRRAVALLDLDGVERPSLFEPGCGIGGGVTQVAQMLPQRSRDRPEPGPSPALYRQRTCACGGTEQHQPVLRELSAYAVCRLRASMASSPSRR